jgi:hypothetical protein
MPVIDPTKDNFASCKSGLKVLALVGFDKRPTKKGDEMQYECHFVCVKDLSAEDNGDKGSDHWERFILRDNLYFLIGQIMKAAGHSTPFDTDDTALISDVLSNCYLTAKLIEKEHNQETVINLARNGWAPYTGAEESDWAEIIAEGVAGHEKIREARRKAAGKGSGSGGGARRPDPAPGEDGGGSANDDSIPY